MIHEKFNARANWAQRFNRSVRLAALGTGLVLTFTGNALGLVLVACAATSYGSDALERRLESRNGVKSVNTLPPSASRH
jgi:hypothetical protein